MKVLVIGATGTIGKAVVEALLGRHEVVPASLGSTQLTVDIANAASIAALFRIVGRVDAIVCAAGVAPFRPLANLTDDDFRVAVASKLMGQVNLLRTGVEWVNDAGSITLTSGILSRFPVAGSAAVSMVNAAVEAFAMAAALELPRRVRVNVVSPPWVTETLVALHLDPAEGMPAATVARAYVDSIEGTATGQVFALKTKTVRM